MAIYIPQHRRYEWRVQDDNAQHSHAGLDGWMQQRTPGDDMLQANWARTEPDRFCYFDRANDTVVEAVTRITSSKVSTPLTSQMPTGRVVRVDNTTARTKYHLLALDNVASDGDPFTWMTSFWANSAGGTGYSAGFWSDPNNSERVFQYNWIGSRRFQWLWFNTAGSNTNVTTPSNVALPLYERCYVGGSTDGTDTVAFIIFDSAPGLHFSATNNLVQPMRTWDTYNGIYFGGNVRASGSAATEYGGLPLFIWRKPWYNIELLQHGVAGNANTDLRIRDVHAWLYGIDSQPTMFVVPDAAAAGGIAPKVYHARHHNRAM